MPDINDTLNQAYANQAEQNARSAVARSSYRATNAGYGMNKPAMATMFGGTLPQQVEPMLQDPLAFLRSQSESEEKEISLDTLSDEEKKKIERAFKTAKDIADKHYRSVIEPTVLKRRSIYDADEAYYNKKFPQLSESCKWVSKDVKTACGWILPGLMEAFTGTDEPLSVKGVNIEDDDSAQKIQQLVRYQLEKKNNFHQFCLAELEAALSDNFGIAKVWWKREEKRTPSKVMLDLSNPDVVLAVSDLISQGRIEITNLKEIEGAPDFVDLEYDEILVKANHPVIEYVPNSELRYTPDAAQLQDCKFVAHRKIVSGDYLKRKELDGVYQGVDEAIEKFDGSTRGTTLDRDNDPDRVDKFKLANDSDNASKQVELYEAYLNVDFNNDGVYEKLIVHAVGDKLLRVAENDFEMPPFFVCSSIYSPNAVFCRDSFSDEFAQLQDLKTALIRQVIVNVAKNNSPRVFVNERNVDMDALFSGDEIIPVQGSPGENIVTPPSLPLSSVTMDMIQYAQNELEAQSGSTRYNQGLDSNSLNHTATGVTAIMGASEKRNKMMARSIAERFFIPVFKFLILLNQKYLEDEQIIRLTNENVRIRREELDIDYDLIVNVGQGAGTREAQIQYLMLVLNQIYPQLAAQGIVNAKSWYNLVVKLLESLGLRDVSQYLLDPESEEAQAQAQAAQAAAAQAQAEALQNSLQLSIAKSSVPRVTLPIDKLPPDVQRQYLKDKLGIETTEKEIAEHEVFLRSEG